VSVGPATVDHVPPVRPLWLRAGVAVVVLALLLRLAHLAAAARSPLSFQIGPDEDYYLRFARDVAFGSGGLQSEFAFMDPLYGHLLGCVLWLAGGSAFPMYLAQAFVDTGTVAMLVALGQRLRAGVSGVVAGAAYALAGPAVAMTATLLKETWVAAFLCGWVLLAMGLRERHASWRWAAFGLYCGLGVLLRSNLMLLVIFSLALPWLANPSVGRGRQWPRALTWLLVGLAIPLALATWRNAVVDGRWSPVPGNGGLVLHQLYNAENPKSQSRYPAFVRYGHPSEAWRAYRAEAERRHGRALSAAEIDAYWKTQALDYVRAHPLQTARNALRKLAEFSAWPEVPNNRAYADERLFSPVLHALPPPFALLFALGLPGLLWLLWLRPHGWLVWPPLLTGVATVAVFFAEDRFRLVVVPLFALGVGVWADALRAWLARRHWWSLASALAFSLALAAWSFAYAKRIPETPMNWQRIASGWFRLGDHERLREIIADVERREPEAVGLDEYRGLLALAEGDASAAKAAYERALAHRSDRHEVWHNYARALSRLGDHEASLAAQARAYELHPLPEYLWEMAQSLDALNRDDEAKRLLRELAADGAAGDFARRARARLASH
jgi:tetratricopeptide (TPR) repeat protein